MRIFLYSDLHISKTSSILPLTDDKYSYRQKMIMNTGKWLADIVREEKPDLIINLGDTFDQHTITSYDIDTASEFFNCFSEFNIRHYVLVGNHEMVNKDFNSIALLRNIENICVIDQPSSINLELNFGVPTRLAFLPYLDWRDIKEFPDGDFLFSHLDIQGSVVRNGVDLKDGILPSSLSKYKLVFNGHIHKASIKNNIINVGSITTHSFSDDTDGVPTCYIFDTNTLDLKQYKSSICPLFRKLDVVDVDDLQKQISNLDSKYNYCIHCICPFEIKEIVKEILEEQSNIINYRLNVKINSSDSNENSEITDLNIQTNVNIPNAFKHFLQESLENKIDLKYPITYYQKVLEDI